MSTDNNNNYTKPAPQARMVMTRSHDTDTGRRKLLELNAMAHQGLSIQAVLNKMIQSTLKDSLDRWITNDQAMIKVKEKAMDIYARDIESPILITGPTGTGKELLAKAFQIRSRDGHGQPFVAINCGGLPRELLTSIFFGHKKGSFTGAIDDNPGLLVKAGGGIVFLDEIGELPLDLQATLLRAIQEQEIYPVGSVDPIKISCRFIAATHHNLEERVELGKFREDLFARLRTHELKITGLEYRPNDIALIASSLDWNEPIPESVFKDIYKYNVRGIQTYIKRMKVYGYYE